MKILRYRVDGASHFGIRVALLVVAPWDNGGTGETTQSTARSRGRRPCRLDCPGTGNLENTLTPPHPLSSRPSPTVTPTKEGRPPFLSRMPDDEPFNREDPSCVGMTTWSVRDDNKERSE